jgi:catechol 2,3-dioxygenase-like lactoylglutathione lyase family enzyme
MEPIIFILYVADQQRSRDFYRTVLGMEPFLDVPGMTEFRLNEGAILGLMPNNGIAGLICPPPLGSGVGAGLPDPASGQGIPRAELYLHRHDPQAALDELVKAGGRLLSPAALRSWGDTAAYGLDPDGHVVAFFNCG